ncbi:glycoprotein-N-acetylgalactosamine 3-beta-galactosyltransferase 1-like [Littorina saxatilis]|uniref:N-acetylgalactosaminide beta-1,3-galactosyltransferase n=1 Tax=Littorina saxatilis TaxID=31220 RepID=A0AAN9ALE6_9CAEN
MMQPHPHFARRNNSLDDLTLSVDASLARTLSHKSRVMCWIPSVEKWLKDRVKAVNGTWVPRCDGHVFFIKTNKTQHSDVISFDDVKDGRNALTEKTVAALIYLYRYELGKYDWFLKGDDDTYIVMENLRFLLAQYNSSQPVYLGHLFKKLVKQGYMSGGASYVLSREALRKLNEEGFQKNKCRVKGNDEDVDIGRCLEAVGVFPHNSIDKYGRSAFHPGPAETHIAHDAVNPWLVEYNRFKGAGGRNCCSELTVSFHHVKAAEILVMDHLLYRTSVYGRVPDFSRLQGLFEPKMIPPPS